MGAALGAHHPGTLKWPPTGPEFPLHPFQRSRFRSLQLESVRGSRERNDLRLDGHSAHSAFSPRVPGTLVAASRPPSGIHIPHVLLLQFRLEFPAKAPVRSISLALACPDESCRLFFLRPSHRKNPRPNGRMDGSLSRASRPS